MQDRDVKMGKVGDLWEGNGSITGIKSITLCVTEDCNLACKYCYMTGKNHKNKMDFDTAKRVIDYILTNRKIFNEGAVIWDFIGGEPFLEIDLIDKVCDYIKLQMYELDHPWFNNYRFSFSTNGLLYNTDKVQRFIKKNHPHLSIGISVDGNELKHDLQRIYPNGKGSYKDVLRNIPLWQEQFINGETKATFSHDDLPYLKDSIISLWDIGIKTVSANVVFEDVWSDGDDLILGSQLDELADYIIENRLWKDYSVRFFDPNIGFPIPEGDKDRNFCGSGKMLAVDCNGNFYPCIRFLDFSLSNKKGRSIGDVTLGIKSDKLRPFLALSLNHQSNKECIECQVATGCAWCTGFNYDATERDTIYDRATFICKMHKATVKSNKRFWKILEETTGEISPRRVHELEDGKKYIQFILNDKMTPHCNYKNWNDSDNEMSDGCFQTGIKFAKENGFGIVLLGDNSIVEDYPEKNYTQVINSDPVKANTSSVFIYDNNIDIITDSKNTILLVDTNNINNIYKFVTGIYPRGERVNIILQEIDKWDVDTLNKYRQQLELLVEFIENTYISSNPMEVNVITDRLFLNQHCNCDAGIDSYTLGPNGKFYVCPAFYFDNPNNSIGDLEVGILNKDEFLMKFDNAPICNNCDAYHCKRCVFINKKLTEEYNTPSKIQCVISHIERNMSLELQQRLINKKVIQEENRISEINFDDPLQAIVRKQGGYVNV